MTALVLALALASDCAHQGLRGLGPEARAATCAWLTRAPPAPAADPTALTPLYARPGFERARQRNDGAVQALLAQLKAWFESLFASEGAQTYSRVTRVLVLALGLGVALAGLLHVATRRRRRPLASPTAPRSEPLHLDEPAAHRDRARALLERDARAAVREGLLALLAHLERRRLARPERAKTNQELARELLPRGAPEALTARVAALLAWYDQAWYSQEPIAPEAARRFVGDVSALLEAP